MLDQDNNFYLISFIILVAWLLDNLGTRHMLITFGK